MNVKLLKVLASQSKSSFQQLFVKKHHGGLIHLFQLTLSDKRVKPTGQDQMVVWVYIRIYISVENKSTSFDFTRDVFGLPLIR